MKRNWLLALFFVLLIGVLAACGGNADETDADASDDANESDDKEVYTVATDNGYVPFEYIDEDSGELVGFDIDLVSALADEVGVEIEFERSEEHTSELQSRGHLVCRLLLEKKKKIEHDRR